MATRVYPPFSSAVVEIADELVGRYEAQGWIVADKAVVEPKAAATPKRLSTQK